MNNFTMTQFVIRLIVQSPLDDGIESVDSLSSYIFVYFPFSFCFSILVKFHVSYPGSFERTPKN
ncbi:hypothetical protein RchiOBHm_Chr5g0007941 [Rosa chinensis]|uniref:Uncharacterized protein n=1 Tax=Rosa chinensis TaxID=74649 RepID=A0A2P6Q410_ROSCH|nr:hypothetical protein RchiOBHm_Chr5g0007941 [Rosa chinensis]